VKSLKAKLKKALEAINKITAESQEKEMFNADDADAAESSNIDATSTSTQAGYSEWRLEQQTIDFFKIHSPQEVNFKDATKNPHVLCLLPTHHPSVPKFLTIPQP